MNSIRTLATALAILGPIPAAQAVTFDVVVTQSVLTVPDGPDVPAATLPPVGTVGSLSITLNSVDGLVPGITDDSPFGDPDSDPNLGSVSASITAGELSASLDFGSILFATDTRIGFANGSFAGIDVSFPREPGTLDTYAGSFYVLTDPDGVTPVTYNDVLATLMEPGARGGFSFNGTTFDGIDTFFRAETPLPPVPLPAGGLLLLSALGTVAVARRRTA